MPKSRGAIVIAILSAILVAGCGDSAEPTKVDLSKTADQAQFKGMIDDQMKTGVKADKSGKPLLK